MIAVLGAGPAGLAAAWRAVLPDGRTPRLRDGILLALWLLRLAVAAVAAARRVSSGRRPPQEPAAAG